MSFGSQSDASVLTSSKFAFIHIIEKWGHERNKNYIAASLIQIQITFWPKFTSFIQ